MIYFMTAVLGRIERYSVVCFDNVNAFEALQQTSSVKGGAHTQCLDVSGIPASVQHV